MQPFISRGFPPRLAPEEKFLFLRYAGIAVWIGAFVSMTAVLVMWPRFGEVPGLSSRVLVAVGGLSFIEAIVGYLLYAGLFLRP